MKIIFDGLIYYLQTQGGISRYLDELLEGFSRRSDCEVILLLRKNQLNKKFNRNIKIVVIESLINSDNKFKKYLSIIRDNRAVNKFLKSNNFSDSIFHYSYYTYYKNLKAKSILTVHDLMHEKLKPFFGGFLNKLYLINKKKSIIKADKIVVISEKTKKDLIDVYNIKERKINVVYHGLSSSFRVLNETDKISFLRHKNIEKPYFVYIGSRALYKNFRFLLETFSAWENNNNYNLFCIGGGEFTDDEINLIHNLKLQNKIKLFLDVSENDLAAFYNCSSSLIFPSLYEGFGFPILEAMACGVNILASDIEIFHEIGQGIPIYFNPTDEKSLLIALDKALLIDKSRIDLGLQIVKNFNWSNAISKTLQIYKQ